MKTRHLIAIFVVLMAAMLLYPKLKMISWREPVTREWRDGYKILQESDYLESRPDGTVVRLGEVWNQGNSWNAAAHHCIFWHNEDFVSKQKAMEAVEKWCGKPTSEPGPEDGK